MEEQISLLEIHFHLTGINQHVFLSLKVASNVYPVIRRNGIDDKE